MLNKSYATLAVATILGCGIVQSALAADTMITPDQMRASTFIGARVYDRDNQDVATVKDVILAKDGTVADVVLSYDTTIGLGGKFIAVKFRDFKFDHARLTIDQSKAQLGQMAAYQLTDDTTGSGSSTVPPTGGHATAPDATHQ